MTALSSPALSISTAPITTPRVQIVEECCPTCDQPIPPDRTEEISARIRSKQQAHEIAVSTRLRRDFALEKANAVETAKQEGAAALDQEREQSAAKIAAGQEQARADVDRARQEADSVAAERIAIIERARQQDKSVADARTSALQEQLKRTRDDAAANEMRIRAEAREVAVREANEQVSNVQREREASEASLLGRIAEVEAQKVSAQEAGNALQARLDQAQHERAEREARAREEGRVAGQAILQAELEKEKSAKAAAEESVVAAHAERQAIAEQLSASKLELKSQKDSHAADVLRAIQETREALTIDKDKAVLETEARTFAERQKLQASVQDLTRQLEKLTAHQRGEGAEIDLFETLKAAFEGDRLRRVKPGIAGADIIHEIIRNGKVCGKIIYDCKNRNDYKSAYASKLRSDQLAEKAEFAVLSSNHFPGKVSQLHLQEGVIVACPARVVTLAQLLRRHVLQLHELRVSAQERDAKTEKLYKFITSEHCRQLLDNVEKLVDDLMGLDVKEQGTHKALWEKRGRMLTSVLKAHGDFCSALERIIGTSE
jgi:hypothetical protein